MPGNTTGAEVWWRTGSASARPQLSGTPPGRAAHPDPAEASYLEDIGRRVGPDGEAVATAAPAAPARRCGGG